MSVPGLTSWTVDIEKPQTYTDFEYKVLTLENQLRVVLISNPAADSAAVDLAVHVGSLQEKGYGVHGLAHFLEHMLFLGSSKYPQEDGYKKFLSQHGGSCNASTSDEWTEYYLTVPINASDGTTASTSAPSPAQGAGPPPPPPPAAPPPPPPEEPGASSQRRHLPDCSEDPAGCSCGLDPSAFTVPAVGRAGARVPTQLEILDEAIDRIAQFFQPGGPLFDPSCTQREVQAVDAEHRKNLQNDARKALQIFRHEAEEGHPLNHFRGGSVETLGGREGLRETLLRFHAAEYCASRMGLAVCACLPLPALQALVVPRFSTVRNLGAPSGGLVPPAGPRMAEAHPHRYPYAFSGEYLEQLPAAVFMEPAKERRSVDFQFFVAEQDARGGWRHKVHDLLGHILGYEGPGSLLNLLKAQGLATGLVAGMYYDGAGTGVFKVAVTMMEQAGAPFYRAEHRIGSLVFLFLAHVLRGPEGGAAGLLRHWQECRQVAEVGFRFQPAPEPLSAASSAARSALLYPPSDILVGGRRLYEYDAAGMEELLQRLTVSNCRVLSSYKGCTRRGAGDAEAADSSLLYERFMQTTHTAPLPMRGAPEPCLHLAASDWAAVEASPAAAALQRVMEDLGLPGNPAPPAHADPIRHHLNLHLPLPNRFVPTEFGLHPPFDADLAPDQSRGGGGEVDLAGVGQVSRVEVPDEWAAEGSAGTAWLYHRRMAGGAGSLFFKHTTQPFEEPRLYVKLKLYSSFIAQDLHSYCMTELLVSALLEAMNEELYDSSSPRGIGLAYDIKESTTGTLEFYAGGLSQKALLLLEDVVQRTLGAEPHPGELLARVGAALGAVKERARRSWFNAAFKTQPVSQATNMLVEVLENNEYTDLETYEWLMAHIDVLTPQELVHTREQILASPGHVEVYMEGNVRPEDVARLEDVVARHVRVAPYPPAAPLPLRGVRAVLRDSIKLVNSPNKSDPNSAVVLYVQTAPYLEQKGYGPLAAAEEELPGGPLPVWAGVYTSLLQQYLHQPFFADLRTKQQLGYIVSASVVQLSGMAGIKFRVQSSRYSVEELKGRVEAFLAEFEFTEERRRKFDTFKQGEMANLKHKSKQLVSAFSARWTETAVRRWDFHRKARNLAALEAMTFDHLEDFYRRCFLASPRLWLLVRGPPAPGSSGQPEEELEDLHVSDHFLNFYNVAVASEGDPLSAAAALHGPVPASAANQSKL